MGLYGLYGCMAVWRLLRWVFVKSVFVELGFVESVIYPTLPFFLLPPLLNFQYFPTCVTYLHAVHYPQNPPIPQSLNFFLIPSPPTLLTSSRQK